MGASSAHYMCVCVCVLHYPCCLYNQTVTLFAYLAAKSGVGGPHLIITPASTIDNWIRELNRWCPHFTVVKYHGSLVERAEYRDRGRFDESVNVVVAPYSYFSRDDASKDRVFLSKLPWEYLVRLHSIVCSRCVTPRLSLLVDGTPLWS